MASRLRAATWALVVIAVVTLTPPSFAQGPGRTPVWAEQNNFNRPGGDFERIEMSPGQKDQCAQECRDNVFCRAYTWVREGVQGSKPVCWLKSSVPDAKPDHCCISGALKASHPFTGTLEPNTDLSGEDYASIQLDKPDVSLCQAACARDEGCAAYTYVRPGAQAAKAVCYLKERVPARKTAQDCCTSGIKAWALSTFALAKDVDLNGADYEDFDVPTGGAVVCERACANDPDCKAFTYVKSTATRPSGHCWLKSGVPASRASNCCTSAVKREGRVEMNVARAETDRPGNDYHKLTPRAGSRSAQLSLCADACGADGKCRAYTFVNAGVQGADPVCYLKNVDSPKGAGDKCCSSAGKRPEFIGKPIPKDAAPPILYFSQNNPARLIEGLAFPDDMPDVRLPTGFKNCSTTDRLAINRAWAMAHHNLWRAHQVMQQLHRRTRDRGALWVYGFSDRMKTPQGDYSNWSPRGWFGSYESRRFRLSRRSIAKVWSERFRGKTFEVQCRRANTDGAHPCVTATKRNPPANHIVYGKINFCGNFFQSANTDTIRAQSVVHEIFHWLKIPDSGYWVSDSHDFWKSCGNYEAVRALYHDDAAFIGMNRGCRDWNHNRAILTNDNYAWFATMLGSRVYFGQMRSFPAEDFR